MNELDQAADGGSGSMYAPSLEIYAEAGIPTVYGVLRTIVFRERATLPLEQPPEHMALVVGDIGDGEDIYARIHSECWTGEALYSLKCDCREQLDIALKSISNLGRGVVLYLRQEGRGIGLGNKIRAYSLQEQGLDTIEANRVLGFAADQRSYSVAAMMFRRLGVRSVNLLTNNPDKLTELNEYNIRVSKRIPMSVTVNPHNLSYLTTKAERMGHDISLPEFNTRR